jgi:hypothetical protein
MKDENSASAEALPRRRFLQLSALGTLYAVTSDWSRRASAQAALGMEPAAGTVSHDFGLRGAPVPTRAPLAPAPFLALPLGNVKARGWLLTQLELQRDGLTGKAEELYDATHPNSAWKGGDGEDWEKGPYYLKGLIALAYTLDDAGLKAKVKAWIEPILASQTEEGFFGPKKNNDWWPRMVATYLLRDYAEASGDERVAPFLTRYYRHMSEKLPGRRLAMWGKARAGDEIDTVLWLYNRTGDEFLLPLADLLAQQTLPWSQIFTENGFLRSDDEWMVNHAVNVPQALKMPVVYSQRSGKAQDRNAYRAGIEHLMRDHGTSFGINSGSELLSGRSSVEGVETCSTVEHMLSAETAIRILGDARIGDELEVIAFNALPAAFSKDFHQHVYYTISNNVAAVKGTVGYRDDHGDDRVVAPRSGFPCCCYNMHMGWPKLAQNSWAATPAGGLAVMAYVPSQVSAPVAGDAVATVACETNYPFEETIRLNISLDKPAQFPLQLRIPGWCKNPQVKVNGRAQPKAVAGSFYTLNRAWKSGDTVELIFPMQVQVIRGINDSVSVRRGPLVYALGLQENEKVIEQNKSEGFESYEVTTDSPWNFALQLNAANPGASFKFSSRKAGANPFETGKSPVKLSISARRVEQWTMRSDGRLSLEPPLSPVASTAPVQTIELVPFGSQMLRVSEFPVVGTPRPLPQTFSEDFSSGYESRWVNHRGSTLRNGQLELPKSAKAIATAAVFADVVYDAEVLIGDEGDAGVILRCNNDSLGTDHYQGYYVGINAQANAVVFGRANNDWQPLASQGKALDPDKMHHIRIEARGAQFRVWVDDMETPILEASDDTYKSGKLGIRSYSNRSAFGKLSARAI